VAVQTSNGERCEWLCGFDSTRSARFDFVLLFGCIFCVIRLVLEVLGGFEWLQGRHRDWRGSVRWNII